MLKKILFAVAPLMLVATSVMAEDSLMSRLAKLDTTDAVAADVTDADDLGEADVDALLGDDEDKSSEDAVAACFQRVGYGYNYGHSYRSYGFSSYNYHSCYTPTYYSYNYYTPTYHYTPVTYSYYTPVYTSYWGCW
ncbi:MAG: hypothetical protein WBD20_22770 [Pirellulaceae bacterium]